MADKYILRITAGPSYDDSTHTDVAVNTAEPLRIKGEHADIELNVRIQNYQGLPIGSPTTSPYFSSEPHATNADQYSISFRFTPHKPADVPEGTEGISGSDLQFGNDFDRPIRDRLPPGFSTALSIVRWWIDPGLDGDAYADTPHLYGPALSSFNALQIGSGELDEAKGGLWMEEGGDEAGLEQRAAVGMPDGNSARMKWALKDVNKQAWKFEYGKTYGFDFYNPYLDFANLALKLPGFHLSIAKYWDGQGLRYVLRNKQSGAVYLVIVFDLLLKEDINDDGTVKDGAAESAAAVGNDAASHSEDEPHDEEKVLKEARERLGPTHEERETNPDDVD